MSTTPAGQTKIAGHGLRLRASSSARLIRYEPDLPVPMSSANRNRPFIPTATAPAVWCPIGVSSGGRPVKSPSHERRMISAISQLHSSGPGTHFRMLFTWSPVHPEVFSGGPVKLCASWVTTAHDKGTE